MQAKKISLFSILFSLAIANNAQAEVTSPAKGAVANSSSKITLINKAVVQREAPRFVKTVPFDWKGFYGGVQIGYKAFASSQQIETSYNPIFQKAEILTTNSLNLALNFYGGYNFVLPTNLLLSVELHFNGVDIEATNSKVKDTTKEFHGSILPEAEAASQAQIRETVMRLDQSFVPRIRLGYIIHDFLPYLSFSLEEWKKEQVILASASTGGALVRVGSHVAYETGLKLGLGLEYALSDHILLRGEYNSSVLRQMKHKAKSAYNYIPQEVHIGVAYKF